jgi:hypothetical protein
MPSSRTFLAENDWKDQAYPLAARASENSSGVPGVKVFEKCKMAAEEVLAENDQND